MKPVDMNGIAVILFSQPLMIPSNISSIDSEVLNVEVKPGFNSDRKKLGITSWEIISKFILFYVIGFKK